MTFSQALITILIRALMVIAIGYSVWSIAGDIDRVWAWIKANYSHDTEEDI